MEGGAVGLVLGHVSFRFSFDRKYGSCPILGHPELEESGPVFVDVADAVGDGDSITLFPFVADG